MYIIIVGAGDIGQALAEMACKEDHDVIIVESDTERAQAAKDRFDAQVFQANSAQQHILEEVDVSRADVLITTTTDDAANLMTLLIGKELGIETLVTVVSNPAHQRFFERHDIQTLTNPLHLVAERLLDLSQ